MSTGNRVQALVDGAQIFQRLYDDIQAVDSDGFVYLSFWLLDPAMTIDVRTGRTLGQLLAQKASQGVKIRILVWDYYTVMAEQVLRGRSQVLPRAALPAVGGLLRLFVGPAIAETLWRRFLESRFVATDDLVQLVRRLQTRRPRPDIELCLAPFPDPTMPPGQARVMGLDIGSHHQKTAILNLPTSTGRCLRAYVLGTNLHDDYWDDPQHRVHYPSPEHPLRARPWHDAGVVAEGPAANDVEAEFIRRWELQRQNYPRLGEIRPCGLVQRFSDNIDCEFLVTAPSPPANNIRDALLDRLRRARQSVYIEDQYFFNLELTNALIEAALRVEDAGGRLHIGLLTNGPEEFSANGIDLPMELFRFVNFTNLQLATCEAVQLPGSSPLTPSLVRRAPGEHWALAPDSGVQRWNLPELQIARPRGAPILLRNVQRIVGGVRPAYAVSTDGRGREARERGVYIHAKLTIIDDRYCFVGSANYSVRSMEYDSEATLKIDDGGFASATRLRLFEEMTGNERIQSMPHERQFEYWNEVARTNALFRELDETRMTGVNVNIIQYPPGFPNFLGVRRRLARELARTDPTFLALFARFLGGGSLGMRLTDAQFLRLLETLYPLH